MEMGTTDKALSIIFELYKRNIEHALEREEREELEKELRELTQAIDQKLKE